MLKIGRMVRGWRGWLINPLTVAHPLPAVTRLDRQRSYEPFAVMRQLLTTFGVVEYKLGSQDLAWGTRPKVQ